MGVEDQLMDSFLEDEQLMVKDGGQKVNFWQSAANKAKDVYYQSLFSGGGSMPLVEKTIGSAGAHEFKLLTRYLSGSGEDMPLSEDQGVIDKYLQTVHNEYGEWERHWTPTTNREINPNTGIPYVDEGWEFKQVNPKSIMSDADIEKPEGELGETKSSDWADVYNKLGETSTVRRRKLEGGDYEYMIVEPWDLIEGEKGKGGTDYAEESEYMNFSRNVPKALGLLTKLAPDFVSGWPSWQGDKTNVSINLSDYGRDWMENKAKPFSITGRSIINR